MDYLLFRSTGKLKRKWKKNYWFCDLPEYRDFLSHVQSYEGAITQRMVTQKSILTMSMEKSFKHKTLLGAFKKGFVSGSITGGIVGLILSLLSLL